MRCASLLTKIEENNKNNFRQQFTLTSSRCYALSVLLINKFNVAR